MNFCKHCGSKLKEGAFFCGECGKPIHDEGVAVTSNKGTDATDLWDETARFSPTAPPSTGSQPMPKERKPLSKKQKITIISLLSAVAIILVSYFVLKSVTDPEKMLTRFEKAIEEKDEKALMDLLSSGSPEVALEKKHVTAFLNFVGQETDMKNYLVESLKDDLKALQKGEDGSLGTFYLKLEKDGKKFLLFDNYKLSLQPVNLVLTSNYANTNFYFNNEKVGTINEAYEEITYGPILPGVYKVKAELEGQFASATSEAELNVYDNFYGDSNIYVNLSLDVDSLEVYTNFTDVEIFINGKSAGTTDDAYFYVDVINLDGSSKIYGEKQFPWGVIRSEEVPIDHRYMDLKIDPITEELESQLAEVIKDFYIEKNEAYATMDVSKITKGAGNVIEDITEDLNYYKDYDYKFFGDGYTDIAIDLDSFELIYEDGDYWATVVVKTTSKGDFYSKDYTEDELSDYISDPETTTVHVELFYDPNQNTWVVSDEYTSWWFTYFSEERVKQFSLGE